MKYAPSKWDPEQYLRYSDERQRPLWDLLDRVRTDPVMSAVDLGCGPGTSTVAIASRWPEAHVVGIDSSEAMIERALAPEALGTTNEDAGPPHVTYRTGDIATWRPAPESLDLVLSNAALHWVPGHTDLFASWVAALRPGGTLAFQVPGNFDAPSHTMLAELAASAQWRGKLSGVAGTVEAHHPLDYYRSLRDLVSDVDVWETTYCHRLRGDDPVFEWVRGTALLPYLERLNPADTSDFTSRYKALLRSAYPKESNGETLLGFRRVFVVATKAA